MKTDSSPLPQTLPEVPAESLKNPLEQFVQCKDETLSLYQSYAVSDEVKDADTFVSDSISAFDRCLEKSDPAINYVVKQDPNNISHVVAAIEVSTERIKTEKHVFTRMINPPQTDNVEINAQYETEMLNYNFALSMVRERESSSWARVDRTTARDSSVDSYTYFNLLGLLLIGYIIYRQFTKNKKTVKREEKNPI